MSLPLHVFFMPVPGLETFLSQVITSNSHHACDDIMTCMMAVCDYLGEKCLQAWYRHEKDDVKAATSLRHEFIGR